ncbi:Mariner Mos1 transposase [Blattella germanica]|nr:Mariner Mos1 transposase [Blattella germanica]
MLWDSDGVILTHCVPRGTTVTGASYQDVLKNKFLPALREKAAHVFFHQDNVPAHRANATQQFLRDNFEVIPHAPYSPDLAPSDFWLFPTLKDILRVRTFTSRAAIASAIFQWPNKTPRKAFAAAMQSWCRHCEKCVRLQGDYVKK